ncbi:MAG: DUF2442 domain-containing protein [Paludibacter sp.]|jgi:hypothetical protein|nr:DUF2442 domain-containing protein [Paludibacter sp.]
MNEKDYISIVDAKYLGDYNVELHFNDNAVRQIDFGRFLKTHPHPQHNKYLKYANFRKFRIDGGNIVWGRNWDLIFNLRNLYKGISPE